jgi:hypothetical protein
VDAVAEELPLPFVLELISATIASPQLPHSA